MRAATASSSTLCFCLLHIFLIATIDLYSMPIRIALAMESMAGVRVQVSGIMLKGQGLLAWRSTGVFGGRHAMHLLCAVSTAF